MFVITDDNASKVRSTTSSSNVPQKTTKRKAWSTDERDAIMKHFSGLILRNKLPGKTEIESVMVKEKSLHSRSWRNIKDFCRNCIVSKSRKLHWEWNIVFWHAVVQQHIDVLNANWCNKREKTQHSANTFYPGTMFIFLHSLLWVWILFTSHFLRSAICCIKSVFLKSLLDYYVVGQWLRNY